MYWKEQMISSRFSMTVSLFLIGALHTMIFAFFQIPGNFLLGAESTQFAIECKFVLYVTAIGVSFCHQFISRRFGLKKVLLAGLFLNMFGLGVLLGHHFFLIHPIVSHAMTLLNMLFFGAALTSVINSLVTYIIIEYPTKTGMGIIALFAVFNLGVMIAPIIHSVFHTRWSEIFLYPILISLLAIAIWYIRKNFFDPPYPKHLQHLRKGTLVWKELHYRLGLYVVGIIGYALTETTFSLWGLLHLREYFTNQLADSTILLFWLFMIVGQVILLVPLYFFPARRILAAQMLVIMGALLYLPSQETLSANIIGLCIGGIACSAVFPILLSMIESELMQTSHLTHHHNYLPYIETGISTMVAGYFFGIGIIDLWIEFVQSKPPLHIEEHFQYAAVCIGISALTTLFLQITRPSKDSSVS